MPTTYAEGQPVKRTKRRAWFVTCGIAALVLIGLGVLGFIAIGEKTFTFTQQQIQEKVDAKMPYEFEKATVPMKVESVKVTFANENHLEALITITGEKFKKPFTAIVFARGVASYDTSSGGFHITPEKKEDVKIQKFECDASLKEMLEKGAERYVDKPGLKNLIKDLAPHAGDALKSAAEGATRTFLKHRPVYVLKGEKGWKYWMARASLASLTIADGTMSATISAWQFVKYIVMCAVFLLIIIVVVGYLIMHPEAGLAILAVGALSD